MGVFVCSGKINFSTTAEERTKIMLENCKKKYNDNIKK